MGERQTKLANVHLEGDRLSAAAVYNARDTASAAQPAGRAGARRLAPGDGQAAVFLGGHGGGRW
jgi:hypothetical protein